MVLLKTFEYSIYMTLLYLKDTLVMFAFDSACICFFISPQFWAFSRNL